MFQAVQDEAIVGFAAGQAARPHYVKPLEAYRTAPGG